MRKPVPDDDPLLRELADELHESIAHASHKPHVGLDRMLAQGLPAGTALGDMPAATGDFAFAPTPGRTPLMKDLLARLSALSLLAKVALGTAVAAASVGGVAASGVLDDQTPTVVIEGVSEPADGGPTLNADDGPEADQAGCVEESDDLEEESDEPGEESEAPGDDEADDLVDDCDGPNDNQSDQPDDNESDQPDDNESDDAEEHESDQPDDNESDDAEEHESDGPDANESDGPDANESDGLDGGPDA